MSETKFTPGRWAVSCDHGRVHIETLHNDDVIAVVSRREKAGEELANAKRIVRCVNLFDELVGVVASELAELEFVVAPTDAQRARRAYLFALLQRVRGEQV